MTPPFLLSLNESWNYSALSELQSLQLAEARSQSEAECLLTMWFNFTNDNVTTGEVTRICMDDGNWTRKNSNYKECSDSLKSHLITEREDAALRLAVQYTLFIGSILSIICLGVSLGIFYYFRCLRCDRVTVQAHLMIALSIRFLLMFVISEPHVLGHTSSYRDVDILCESILIGFLYSTFSSISWMFIQGLYLNFTLTAGVINNIARYHLILYYLVGWVVPALFTLAYVVAMLLRKQERCWNGYSEMNEMWILLCPIMFEVVVNGMFLLNILRILLRKVRNSNSRPDTSQIKAAAKATALLFPVLGISNLFLLYNPGGDYNKYFVALNTFFGSTQGIFVAIVYCFNNKEVWGAVRRSFQRARARRGLDIAGGIEHEFRIPNSHNGLIELTTRFQQPSMDTNCLEQDI